MHFPRQIGDRFLYAVFHTPNWQLLFAAPGVGCKTFLSGLLKSGTDSLYTFSLKDPKIRQDIQSEPENTLKQFGEYFDFLCFDGLEYLTDPDAFLNYLVQNWPEKNIIFVSAMRFTEDFERYSDLEEKVIRHTLLPLSLFELQSTLSLGEIHNRKKEWMKYGLYPKVLKLETEEDKQTALIEFVKEDLLAPILDTRPIHYPQKLKQLLNVLARMLGEPISYSALGRNLKIRKETVAHYITLLEMAGIIFRLTSFNRSIKKEISGQEKIYFWDLGIRNAVVSDFSPIEKRKDKEAIWENFLIAERQKQNLNLDQSVEGQFWKVYTGAHLSYLEQVSDQNLAIKISWNPRQIQCPSLFNKSYPETSFDALNKEHYLHFLNLGW